MKFLLISFLMITTTVFAQKNSSPARNEGACYASLILQKPPALAAQERAPKFKKYNQAFENSYKICNQKGVDPSNTAAFSSCMKSTGLSNDNLEYMIGFINNASYIKNNNLSSSDIGLTAVQWCM